MQKLRIDFEFLHTNTGKNHERSESKEGIFPSLRLLRPLVDELDCQQAGQSVDYQAKQGGEVNAPGTAGYRMEDIPKR